MSLLSRYDSLALRVEPLRPLPPAQASTAVNPAWKAWCLRALDLEHPGSASPPRVPLALGFVADEGGATAHSLEALSRDLDGDHLLRACHSAAARWRLKLRVKAQDLTPWRARRASDIWDCGYLAATPALPEHLARFRPRRPTLMVADPMPQAALQAAVAALSTASAGYSHPVRVLAALPATDRSARLEAAWSGLPASWLP